MPTQPETRMIREMAHGADQGDASTHNNLGVFYYSKGMSAEALKEFRTALEVDPENNQALENLKSVNRQTGLYDRTLEAYKKSVQMFPSDAEAVYNLANAYRYTGQFDKAV